MKISVLIKEPDKAPRHVNIANNLQNLQRTVGGNIEAVTLTTDLVIICCEEGRILKFPHCCNICGIDFVGTIIICGAAGDKFADLPVSWADMKVTFPQLWR